MKYTKPELVLLADARAAIQSGQDAPSDSHKQSGSVEILNSPTQPAYEADE